MRVLVVGAGATGGYFGARLVAAGRDVTFLLREGRARQVRESGLTVVSPQGDLSVKPKVVTAAELRTAASAYDLIILSVKSYQLAQAMEDVAPAVGSETLLLPILNGMRQLSLLQKRFGAGQVLGGSVRIVANLDEKGRVVQRTPLEEFSYGELSGERTARIARVDERLQCGGFDAILQPDILATLWQKWWILASLGSICILARGTVGSAAEAPRGKELAHAVVRECVEIAASNGYPANAAMLADHQKRITEEGSSLTSSLYRDMVAGAPVEADHILGDLLDHAQKIPAPLLTAAFVQLKVYEAGRKR